MPKSFTSHKIFSHLTDEERIDKACELLAIGVMRLAEKEGLLQKCGESELSQPQDQNFNLLHFDGQPKPLKEAA